LLDERRIRIRASDYQIRNTDFLDIFFIGRILITVNLRFVACLDCIMEWISRQPTCPVDRRAISVPELKPVPR
jgi:hypothetical protein